MEEEVEVEVDEVDGEVEANKGVEDEAVAVDDREAVISRCQSKLIGQISSINEDCLT